MSCQSQQSDKSRLRDSGEVSNANVVRKIEDFFHFSCEMLSFKALIFVYNTYNTFVHKFVQTTDQCCDMYNGQLFTTVS